MPTFYIDVELSGTVGLNITADDKDQAIKKAQNASYEATGIKVIVTAFPTYAQMEAQVKSGNIEWDIVECESRMYARGTKAGIFEPLDLSLISTKDFVEGSVTKDSVGLAYYAFNLAYSTNKWAAGKGPLSMKDFWDVKKFPGLRTMKFTAASSLEAALLADGVPRDKIYPLDVDRALRKLTELKPYIVFHYQHLHLPPFQDLRNNNTRTVVLHA